MRTAAENRYIKPIRNFDRKVPRAPLERGVSAERHGRTGAATQISEDRPQAVCVVCV